MDLDLLRHQPRLLEWVSVSLGPINRVDGLITMMRKLPRLPLVVEVGSHVGVAAEVMLHFCDRLIAVDSWAAGHEWAKRLFDGRFAHDKRVSYLWMPSLEAAQLFQEQSVDMVYIDANHSEECVLADLAAWLPKIKRGGYLAGHDYVPPTSWSEVKPAVDRFLGPPDEVFADSSWYVCLGGAEQHDDTR